MRIDLHTHSNRSDGTDTPAELVRHARDRANLDVVAITDHDATSGWGEAEVAAGEVGIRLVRGIEISTTFQGQSVHLLGYEFDPHDPDLVAELERVRGGRDDRLPRMLEALAQHGIDLTEADVAAVSGDAVVSGRPHVADAMVAKGYIAHRDEAFRGWLNEGGKAYIGRYAAPLERAIELLKAAGGKAVIAHPWGRGKVRVLTPAVFEQLSAMGLDGIEVDHNDHNDAERAELRDLAASLGLVATGSSDYHGTGKSAEFKLGANLTDPDQFAQLLA